MTPAPEAAPTREASCPEAVDRAAARRVLETRLAGLDNLSAPLHSDVGRESQVRLGLEEPGPEPLESDMAVVAPDLSAPTEPPRYAARATRPRLTHAHLPGLIEPIW